MSLRLTILLFLQPVHTPSSDSILWLSVPKQSESMRRLGCFPTEQARLCVMCLCHGFQGQCRGMRDLICCRSQCHCGGPSQQRSRCRQRQRITERAHSGACWGAPLTQRPWTATASAAQRRPQQASSPVISRRWHVMPPSRCCGRRSVTELAMWCAFSSLMLSPTA